MAIYRKGKATLSENGIITGVGTKWKTSLALLRAGATMVFATNPAVYVTVADIVSDTELRAIDTGGKTVQEESEYVIFLHDSLTVDGLAQDVAETLRYYQGKENQFAHFIEVVKNLDMDELEKVIERMKAEVEKFEENFQKIEQKANEVEENASRAEAAAEEATDQANLALGYKNQAKASADKAGAARTEAARQVDLAKIEVLNAKDEVQLAKNEVENAKEVVANAKAEVVKEASDIVANAKSEVVQEAAAEVEKAKQQVALATEQVELAKTQVAIAEEQAEIAGTGAREAKAQADRAEGYANEIKDIGLSLDATNLLRKDKNLSDVTDVNQARKNIKVDRFQQDDNMTRIKSNSDLVELRLGQDEWYVYSSASDSTGGYIPLHVNAGGTGANNAEEAKINLDIDRIKQEDAMTYIESASGKYGIFIGNDGHWGALDLEGGELHYQPLPVESGGTGASVPDEARKNLKLDRFHQDVNMTRILSEDSKTEFRLGWNEWGVYRTSDDSERGYIALPIKAGGTGATELADARKNLEFDRLTQEGTITRLYNAARTYDLFIDDSGNWGATRVSDSSNVALGVSYGGTGATSLRGAKEKFGIDRFKQHGARTEFDTANGLYRIYVGDDGDWGVLDKQSTHVALKIGAGGTGSTSPEGARANLQLDRFSQSGEQTYMYAQNKKMKVYVDNNGDWGAYDESTSQIKPLQISRGGTGAADAAGARNMLGVGEGQAVTFGQITAKQLNGANGGIFQSDNLNTGGQRVSMSRIYSEVQGGICKTTIHTSGNGKNNYVQINEDGMISGLSEAHVSGVVKAGGDIWAGQGAACGVVTYSGGNKNIFLQNVAGDGNVGSWVNLLQGNWHNGYWQLGAIRGGGTDISCVRLGVNNQGADWKWFDFNNSYGGHLTALRGFKGQCVAGGWALDGEYMGAPFYADSVVANDGGYSPVVAGGTRSTGGYDLRYSFGAISGGTGDWPRPNIHMMGDGTYHRGFEFRVDGRITAWDTGIWGGSFEFQRVAISDRDLKKDIEYNDGKASYDNIMKFKPSTFVYKSDKYNRLRRGVIAQDLYEIDPEYVRIIPGSPIIDNDAGTDEEGKLFITDYHDDTLGLDNNVIMIDTALATRYIGGIVERQAREIEDLKAKVAKMEEIISKLIKEQI